MCGDRDGAHRQRDEVVGELRLRGRGGAQDVERGADDLRPDPVALQDCDPVPAYHQAVPPSANGPDGLWLFELAPRLTRLENAVLKEVDPPLTFRQYRVLRRIVEGHTTVTAIGRLATITLPAVSESIDGLVRRGLLARQVDESDRRSSVLTLTAQGERSLADADARLDELAVRILSELELDDRDGLARGVSLVSARVTELLRDLA